MRSPSAILQLICPDRPGLVSELSGWVASNGGNIRHADHHTDAGAGVFLSRLEWDLEGFGPVSYTHLTLPTKRIV